MTFTAITNQLYTALPSVIDYHSSVPDLTHVGIYNLAVTYSWGGFGADTTATLAFTLELQDPCVAFMTIPTFPSTVATLLDPNVSHLVTPTIVPANPNYDHCQVSITGTVTKLGLPDVTGFVTWTDIVL